MKKNKHKEFFNGINFVEDLQQMKKSLANQPQSGELDKAKIIPLVIPESVNQPIPKTITTSDKEYDQVLIDEYVKKETEKEIKNTLDEYDNNLIKLAERVIWLEQMLMDANEQNDLLQ